MKLRFDQIVLRSHNISPIATGNLCLLAVDNLRQICRSIDRASAASKASSSVISRAFNIQSGSFWPPFSRRRYLEARGLVDSVSARRGRWKNRSVTSLKVRLMTATSREDRRLANRSHDRLPRAAGTLHPIDSDCIDRESTMRPILFLDLDDVICINAPYGGYDVFAPNQPGDLWERLFHKPAVETLLQITDEFQPHVVLTTSWLRLMDRGGFEALFVRTGLSKVASSLHPVAWEAPQGRGKTRLDAIAGWLSAHHEQEPFVVLDDSLSGTGLIGSSLHQSGAVVLCELGVGLTSDHLDQVRRALVG